MWLDCLSRSDKRVVIITDSVVLNLYANNLFIKLKKRKSDTLLLSIPSSEGSKNREIMHCLEDQLIDNRVGKNSILVGLGGGVVTDITGYLAATYLRGVSVWFIPTTLMAMVDAAIGGKNGINHPKGKNLFGTINEPDEVIIESKFLKTLPNHIYKEGFIEVIKYGLIFDASFFSELERGEVKEKRFIDKSIQIKKSIVKRDPRESGLRRILNFGHSTAHGIEKCSDYKVEHGKAVWFGILVETYLSFLLGYLSQESLARIASLLLKENVRFFSFPSFDPVLIYETMRIDKKALDAKPRCVLLKRIGKCHCFEGEYCREISYADFFTAFSWGYNLIENPCAIRSLTA